MSPANMSMLRLRIFWNRILMLFRRPDIEGDLEEEIRTHIEMQEDDHRQSGMNAGEARRAALLKFGGVDQVKELFRDRYRFPITESILQDLGHAFRTFRKDRGFTATVILTLALGIGANAAVFSIVNGVLLRPLPYKDPDRIVRIIQHRTGAESGAPSRRVAALGREVLAQWRTQSKAFSHMAGYFPTQLALREEGIPARLRGSILSPAMFPILGATPLLGRVFGPDEEQMGNHAVVVLSYSAWQKYLAGRQDILNRTLNLESGVYRIVGVMPEGFEFPDRETEFWLPLVLNSGQGNAPVQTLARLADGVSLEQAASEANALFGRFQGSANRPGAGNLDQSIRIELVRMKDDLVGPVRPAFLILMVAVGFVLLIACANVAGLLLARAASRQSEIALRAALGASTARLIRQVLTESVSLALIGGILGTMLAFAGLRFVTIMGAAQVPRIDQVRMDATVLVFSLVISVITGIVFGLVPAIRVSRANHLAAIQKGNPSRLPGSPGFELIGRNRARGILAIGEIALALILLVGTALLIQSFLKLSNTDWGYNPQSLLTFRISLPESRFPGPAAQLALYDQLLMRLQEITEIRYAALTSNLPILQPQLMGMLLRAEGEPQVEDAVASIRVVSRDYLRTMGMRLIEGRDFEESDRSGPPVIFVNRALAVQFFHSEKVVGHRVLLPVDNPAPLTIIGVIDDVRYAGLDTEPVPELYLNVHQAFSILPPPPPGPGAPFSGARPPSRSLLGLFAVRTAGDPTPVLAQVRSIANQMDSQLIMDDIATMEERLEVYVARPRFYTVLLGIFSAIAVALATIGIYGLLAYSVSRRTREIGIRIALGAERRNVLWHVVGQGLMLSAIGIAVGSVAALQLTKYLEKMLIGITPTDGFTFISVAGFLAVAAAFASYIPARRATKVDPVIAIRHE